MYTKPMLAKPFTEHYSKITFPCFVQPKLDGVRLLWNGNDCFSRTGKPLSVGTDIMYELFKYFINLPLDGELYSPYMTFEEISGSARSLVNKKTNILKYHVFDQPSNLPFSFRNLKLETFQDIKFQHIEIVPSIIVKSLQEIYDWHGVFVSQGYEGVIVRWGINSYENKRTDKLLKLKLFEEEDATIIGVQRGEGKYVSCMGNLTVKGKDWICDVGTGFSDEQRVAFWDDKNLLGRTCTIKYQELTNGGVPRFPVFIKLRDLENGI